jgi:hypothetical protein
MAPEQARGSRERLDERSDIWAAGATLFTLLTGVHVHPGRTTSELLRSSEERVAAPLREQRRDVPHELAALIDRALAFEPAGRFQSASEMRVACEDCRRSLTVRGEQSRLFAPTVHRSPAFGAGDPSRIRRSLPIRAAEPRAGFWLGRMGRLWWFYYTGPCTEETWDQYLEMVKRMLDSWQPATLLCLAHRADAPNPLQRKKMADFINRNRIELRRLDRFALVVDSVLHRGAITAINWLVGKPFDERVFNSPLAAIKWLAEPHAELDREEIRTAIVAQVPQASLWHSLRSEAGETIRSLPLG